MVCSTYQQGGVKVSLSDRAVVDQFNLRFPRGMREQLKDMAMRNCRSMNSEIIFQLQTAISNNVETKKADAQA
ncbi:hypothetical protein AGR7C_Cc160130 [Agrobacterium deltaense Zutra 3/1]|uniref:Arc-like DNA binding domain-containing protein n=1 Tax=Agrobacterium deltaense Zutra 3/1 TaxID=1183427 RepID=A0A1S7PL52_9HYPH|nr:hypothetical protein AGR7C_Cc160130 [Agrobacterium deltaense Zutra 3/1]